MRNSFLLIAVLTSAVFLSDSASADGACPYFCPDGAVFIDNPNPNNGWLTIPSGRPQNALRVGDTVIHKANVEGHASGIYFQWATAGYATTIFSESKFAASGTLSSSYTFTTPGTYATAHHLIYPRSLRVCTIYKSGEEIEGVRPTCGAPYPAPTKAERDALNLPSLYCKVGFAPCFRADADKSLPSDGFTIVVLEPGSWSDWSACSVSCGLGGTQTRTCTPSASGTPCQLTNLTWGLSESRPCDPVPPLCICGERCQGDLDCESGLTCKDVYCVGPEDGLPLSCKTWGPCSAVCDGGTQTCEEYWPCSGASSCGSCPPAPESERVQVCNTQTCNAPGAGISCDINIGFSGAGATVCKSVSVNSQGLILDKGETACPPVI